MKFETAVELLKEFYYEKNGKQRTISFLIWILNELVNGEDKDE